MGGSAGCGGSTEHASLKGIDCGDIILVTMPDGTVWYYTMESTDILGSNSALRIPTIAGEHLMLTTCYPFYYTGHAPKKFVVIASLVSDRNDSGH